MVSPVFNSDPQQSMVHQPRTPPPCNDFGGQPHIPQDGRIVQGQFDSEAHEHFMRSLG